MRGIRLNEEYARRRNNEDSKIAKSREVDQYFDKWNRITSRFGHWTGPEYYKAADRNHRESEQKRFRLINLERRRNKLRKQLINETMMYEQQIKDADLERPKGRQLTSEMLRKIRETAQRTEEVKHHLDLESQLYRGRGQTESPDSSIVLHSKTINEALAKMNWLDKQVSHQLEKEKNDYEREDRRLRFSEEERKREELLSTRKHKRYEEIGELQEFEEKKVQEVRSQQEEIAQLRQREMQLRRDLEQIGSELSQLESATKQRADHVASPHNFRQVKMQLRDRSDVVRSDLRHDIEMLNRVPKNNQNEQLIGMLRDNFEKQYDLEVDKHAQIEAMYESEAKEFLAQQQDIWTKDSDKRIQQLRNLLAEQEQQLQFEIDFLVKRQTEIDALCESEWRSAQDAADRIRNLREIDEEDDRAHLGINAYVEGVFEEEVRKSPTMETMGSAGPTFGRKKFAWT